jgi:hypothetical protein
VLAGSSLLAAASTTASADVRSRDYFLPGNLASGSVYAGRPAPAAAGVTVPPPDCTSGCVTATTDGAYPQVFNNVLADPSFG